ncbi:cation:proton antiporter [Amycolatopsis cihanbeyliensis]|uniref:Sodium/proton antiporter (CPA1 family) n=1 Tax=Amycolatopsis cihanbeyliensis TaxID=1128664 RepID=A0A542DF99_AMYCI|nr:cation:proton antiporter [Amycolatopsis cihanbeyliensis]TQJ01733.1 sodium/proton antiporter (CPA1 family) [Amycolatopsis cihanbeyliensis]
MTDLLVLAALLLGYGLVSGRLHGTAITAPMVFVTAGLVLGQGGLGWLSGTAGEGAVRVLAEATLVLVLFTDAVRIDLPTLRREYHFPLRLLAIGMPVGILLGTVAAWLIFEDFGMWEACLLAAVLAPTDAALGAAVVADRRLPVRVRQSLNVESGLNDGIALPVVLLLVALAATGQGDAGSAAEWAWFAVRQIGLGVTVGVAGGTVGGWLLNRLDSAGWLTPTYRRLAVLALAALVYAGAELATGNGFIAAFVAGLCFGSVAREQCQQVHEFAEREGELLGMATFTMFAAVIAGSRLTDIDWPVVAYAVLSLVVVRMLAVAIAMLGSRVRFETTLFFGWFGPRGLASILFALLVVEQSGVASGERTMLVASVTVVLSVYAHGLTAAGWARGFARRARTLAPEAPEHLRVTEHHVR